ncbi:mitochondrial ribonuclease P catalytic subunit-like [Eupeodes corollae]|uniref:mitochondrial ribonuclease P catalytic subunit-like n=1 Tax=Eupeodes corollae TaxID=290404 RepID=UPI002492382F|nr:mitochondrial ribonuclease P catalytic subunit-like [Eupeodes corollae]
MGTKIVAMVLCHKQRKNYAILPRADLVSQFKQKVHEDETHLCPSEWKKLRDELVANVRNIHLQNIDALILGQCNDTKDLPIAKNYIQFLESEGIQPNNASLGKLLKTYYLAGKDSKLSQSDELEIMKIYNKIRADRDALDAGTCKNLIHGLLATSHWKDCVDILKIIQLSTSPSIGTYCAVISKAFASGQEHLGWTYLEEMMESNKQPTCEVYISYIDYASMDPLTFVENMDKMFEFVGKHEILVSEAVIEKLKSCLERLGHGNYFANLNSNGKCSNCKSHMRNISISDDEFKTLSTSFWERVLIRKDVFQKSTPKEVEDFTKFIEKTGPYDCVIDGLNVAYSCGAKKPPKVYVNLLSLVVKYFKRQGKHVLVLGRKHMNNWPKEGMSYVKRNACMFLTNDLSHDDPFLLYAAIKSGQTTDFFSRDLMRSHAFLLGPELKHIFKRWQQEHQYSLLTVSEKGIVVKEPTRYFKFAQKVNNTWHLPYKAVYSPNPPELLEVPENWICIKWNK